MGGQIANSAPLHTHNSHQRLPIRIESHQVTFLHQPVLCHHGAGHAHLNKMGKICTEEAVALWMFERL